MMFEAIDYQGNKKEFSIDGYLAKALDVIKVRVKKRGWDSINPIVGLPSTGKSTLSWTLAKYCDENFTEKNIAFTDEEFIQITNSCPPYSAVILDESFASMNTKLSMTAEFLRIINHLQLIRQKNLFIFLCLPNFFDLQKSIAIFRTSILFLTYDVNGQRGRFMVWDRMNKKKLYILGSKYIDYNCVPANFRGRFNLNEGIIDENAYNLRKRQHLLAQGKQLSGKRVFHAEKVARNKAIFSLKTKGAMPTPEIAKHFNITEREVQYILRKCRETEEMKDTN